MGAWIVLVVVIAGMVTLFVVIAIAVSHTGQTTPFGRQPGNEPAFMPAYEAARSRVGTQSAWFDIMVSEHD